jgi:hypothetical protein
MSSFLLNTLSQAEDRRLSDTLNQLPSEYRDNIDSLWDRSGFISNRMCGFVNGMGASEVWEIPGQDDIAGAVSCYVIEGITYSEAGFRLANCNVRAFTVSDDQFQGMAVSDSTGQFHLGTLSSAAHFLVASHSSPDLGGGSNTYVMPGLGKTKIILRTASNNIRVTAATGSPKNVNVRLRAMQTTPVGSNITLGPNRPTYDASLKDREGSNWELRPMKVWWNNHWEETAMYVELDGRRGQVNTTGRDSSEVE